VKTTKSKYSHRQSSFNGEIVTVGGKEAKISQHNRGGYTSYRVRYWKDGKRVEITAVDLETARKRAKEALKRHESGAGHVHQFSPKETALILTAVNKLQKINVPLIEAVTTYCEAHKLLDGQGTIIQSAQFYLEETKRRKIPDIKVSKLVEEFLVAKKQDGCSKRYLDDAKSRLNAFQKVVGGNIIGVSSNDIDTYLRGINGAQRTRKNSHTIIRSLFSFARSKGYLPASEKTVAEIISKIKVPPSKIGILTPEGFEAVLRCATTKTLPAFVLGGLCGLRHAEICRLDWSAINFKTKNIEVNAGIAKTARRRLAPIPDVASQWLKPIAKEAGRVIEYSSAVNLSIMMRNVWEKAKVSHSQNCLRHSAVSYRLAQIQDAAKTAYEMGNSVKMLYENYRELVTKEDAERWYSIAPKKTRKSAKKKT